MALGTLGSIEAGTRERRLLRIELFVFKGLDERQIDMLKQEVAAIWAPQDVTVEWSLDEAVERVRAVVDRPALSLPATGRNDRWNVASTRVVAGRVTPPIYVSVDAAERVVRGASPPFSSPELAGIMVPRVVARALAHELAHVLLNTRAHTRRGLLRARFTADDFLAPARDGFTLDGDQMARAHQHQALLVPPR
jgi:hypothetical protein